MNEKKNDIVRLIKSFLKVNIDESIFTHKEFQEFLLGEKITFLKIAYLPNSNKLLLINNDSVGKEITEKEISVTFYKVKPGSLEIESFLDEVDFVCSRSTPTKLIFNEIDSNIIPKIGKKDQSSISYIDGFKEKLITLEKKQKNDKVLDKTLSEDNWDIILTPNEEVDFWKSYCQVNQDERTKKILGLYSKIEKYFTDEYEASYDTIFNALSQIINTAEELLNDPTLMFNSDRLRNFVTTALDNMSVKITTSLNKLNLADYSSSAISNLLEYQKAVKFIKDRVDGLNSNKAMKKKINLNNTQIIKISYRIDDLIELKSLLNEVNKILPEAGIEGMLKTFKNNNNLKGIEEIKTLLDKELEKIDNDIVAKLFETVFTSDNHAVAVLRELQTWKTVFSRPKIQQLTYDKRKNLLNLMKDYLTQLNNNFESRNQESIEDTVEAEKIKDISVKISQVVFGHTLKLKAENCKKLTFPLRDIEQYSQYLDSLEVFISKVDGFIKETIGDWANSFSSSKLETLLPKVGMELLEVNKKTGYLNVNFPENLFTLISDIRVITEYGYGSQIPSALMKIHDEGQKVKNQANTLLRIANNYNNLSTEVIPSQKPMLVKCAKEFETRLAFVTENAKAKDKTKTLDLDSFVSMVNDASLNLQGEIRKLKKSHSTILDYICQLMNYDLISGRVKWKEILKKARTIFDNTCESYKDEYLTAEWKNHWDFQIYKVLKIKFSMSLERFFEFVTEVDCRFAIHSKELILDPPIEELKRQIYKEVKTFVSIPSIIIGIKERDHPEYFSEIIKANGYNIENLYSKIQDALSKVEMLKNNLSEVLSLSGVDFETYIVNNFSKTEHWKNNHDSLRKKEKEIEKLEDSIKIDCFKINLTQYKSFMADTFEKVFDTLGSTLKGRLNTSIKIVDEFIKEAMEIMSRKATTASDLHVFKTHYRELTKKKFENKKTCDNIETMNKLLLQLTGQAMNLSGLDTRWENFDVMMNSYSQLIEEQREGIKNDLSKKMIDMNTKLEKFHSKWTAIRLPDNYIPDGDTDINEIVSNTKAIYNEWSGHEKELNEIIEECKNFEIELPSLEYFQNVRKEITQDKGKWELMFTFTKDLESMYNEEWLSIRHKAFGFIQDFTMNWGDRIKKREKDFIYFHIAKQIETFKQSLGVYKFLIGDNFERDHWKSLFNLLKFDNKITKENLIFGNFIDKTELLVKKQAEIKDLYSRAQGEILIRNAISELTAWFETAEFIFVEHVSSVISTKKTPLIKEWKEVFNEISEKSALLTSVKSSEFFLRFSDIIEQFETKFSNIDIWLQNLNLIQRKWIYLEPIFSRGSLPKEASRFKKIDDEFRNIMQTLNANPKVSSIFTIMGIKDTLEMLIDQLEKCQKALNDFLEDKRNKFPRLYFLGDDDLLEFLAKSKDKFVIKNNLKKLYQGIAYITTTESGNTIKIKMIESSIGEKVKLVQEVSITDELEKWLNDLTNEMRSTLSVHLGDGVKKNSNLNHLETHAAQLCGLIEMITFTYNIEGAIKSNKLKDKLNDCSKLIESLTLIQAKTGNNPVQLFKIKNLMLDLIHNREVVEVLLKHNVTETFDWYWFSQLKYYYEKNQIRINMCDGNFEYTYEYQGSSQRLVHTPLTDKCYLTLTQALRLGYGGNPYGPAGTGKTESVKALGQAFGRQVLVFNCDEGIDFKAMGRIFIGLVKSGAWGCFDEFNRLLEEQLSAISIQIQIIQYALKNKISSINLLNQCVNVNFNSAIFVTLNPAGKGYGGRSKLPDNLKILFRPIAMSVPDNLQIAQTQLYAEGFKHADKLAQKVVALFSICKQGLSNQQHYDWGLRALKAILTVANQQIQLLLTQGIKLSLDDEIEILIKAIRINVLSKLTFEDCKNFNLLIQDVFPGVKMNDITYEDLNKALLECYKDSGFELIDSQFKKVVQFHEACKQRMGVVLVGPSGCGKSAIWKLLKSAYLKMNQQVMINVINPKSMPRSLLLGHMNHDTGEYTYGVLTKCAREVEKENPSTKCWIICDGDVDPEWIEALNSVMDDNRLLTMQNGERINFGSNVNFIFETDSLKFASPATISRTGIIYMNQEDLEVKAIVNSYIGRNSHNNSSLVNWFENYFYEAFNNIAENHTLMLNTTLLGQVNNFLSLLGENVSKTLFVDSLVKGLGANLSIEARRKLAMEIYSLTGEKPPSLGNPLNNYYDSNSHSLKELIYDSSEQIDIKSFSSMKSNPLVKTPSALCYLNILSKWLEQGNPFIIIGPEGCGKSILIHNAVMAVKGCSISIINCTSQTNAINVINKLIQSCVFSNTAKGKVLRPKDSAKLILYLKDINLPKPDKYNTIQLISFLQQIITYQGYFDENLDFIFLDRIQIIASMNPSSTLGRYEITSRLTGNVKSLYIDYPHTDELSLICNAYLDSILDSETLGNREFKPSVKQLSDSVITIYNSVKNSFKVDDNRHYIFTVRDISNWIISLLRYEVKSKEELIEVFGYEACRVFRDKLVSSADKTKFDRLLSAECSKFKTNLNVANLMTSSIIFTAMNTNPSQLLQSTYCLNKIGKDDYIELLNKGQMIFERDNADLIVYYFEELLNCSKIIDRLIYKSCSNILLVGTHSSSRKKTVRLVASTRHIDILSPLLTKEYSIKDFKKSIKDIYQITGVDGRPAVFLIEEYHISKPEFMEYLNSLLCSGEVPGLFTGEEMDGMLMNIANEFKEQHEYRSLYDFFISKVRKFLKIVILLDYDNKELNNYISNNPALVTKCSVVWYPEFSSDFLNHLTKEELKETLMVLVNSKISVNPENIISMILAIYNSLPEDNILATHGKFIELLNNFKRLVKLKISSSSNAVVHLQSGLSKLSEAEKFVEELSGTSIEQKRGIEQKQAEADLVMKSLIEAIGQIEKKKVEKEELNKKEEAESKIVQENKSVVEKELADVLPQVEKARNLVKSLDSSKLAELRVYFKNQLKSEVYYVLKAVLQLIGYNDLTSEEVKSTFGTTTISSLASFDVKKLTKDNYNKVLKIVNDNQSCFDKGSISRINFALAQLAEYVTALLKFYRAKQDIKPLEDALDEAEAKLNATKERQNMNLKDLAIMEQQKVDCEQVFSTKKGEAEVLKLEFKKTEELLNKAKSLLLKLTGEKIRWQAQIDELKLQNDNIPYNSLLSAAFITFMPYYNEAVRERMMKNWIKIVKVKDTFSLIRFLLTESDILKLKAAGLPTDNLSLENAIVVQQSAKTTLIIDPVTKATEWFKKSLTSNSNQPHDIVSLHDNKIMTNIELAIRFGKVLLITDVDKIEPFLISIIRGETLKQGPRSVMKIGEKIVDLHEKFRLYLSTRDSSIEITNNIMSSLSVVNFTVTKSGLEGILLGLTIDIEQPDLEKKKNELLEEQDKIKLELSEVEKKLLDELICLEGNLLENKALIDSLEESKRKSMKSEESLRDSIQLTNEIDSKRDIYKPLAVLATKIYILLQDLHKINPMYQFSLENFMLLFKKTVKECNTGSSNKIEQLQKTLISNSFNYYSRSLFKSDLLVFGLYYIVQVFTDENKNKQEWNFLTGAIPISESRSNTPSWLSAERKEIYTTFASAFGSMVGSLKFDSNKTWEEWYQRPAPENDLIKVLDNLGLSKSVQPIHRLLIIQVFRPDRLESAMRNFICEKLGLTTINPPSLSLANLLEEQGENKCPVLFLTTLGSDPSRELEEFSTTEVGRENYIEIPLGGGDNDKVLFQIRDAATKGNWICLKNLHLIISYLPTLEKEINSIKDAHPKYRMFLTAEPHAKFSKILLESCSKITYETPPGVKKNMERIYQNWSTSIFNSGETVSDIKSQALFAIAFIHAILQERRTYIPQGWSKFYEFSYSDLKVSTETILEYLNQNTSNTEEVWKNIRGLIVNSFYGGRIDNDFDFKVMSTYIHKILDRKVLSDKGAKLLNKLPVLNTSDVTQYIKLIGDYLPDTDDPKLFGLPLNVDRSVQRYISTQVISKLNNMFSAGFETLKFDKEKWGEKLTPLINIWKIVYNGDNLDNLYRNIHKVNSEDPIILFFRSELIQIYDLAKLVDTSLTSISNALFGNSIITSSIYKQGLCLLQNKIPEEWVAKFDGPELPMNYIKSLGKKLAGLPAYIKGIINENILDSNINLSELLHPEAFINALRQKNARKMKIPIDEIELCCDVLSGQNKGAKISGLFLQGSDFDGKKLCDISGNKNELVDLPVLNFYFVKTNSGDSGTNSTTTLEIPVYENIFREVYICKLKFGISGDIEETILKGIAICLDSL
jgi:dynein heavy chain 2